MQEEKTVVLIHGWGASPAGWDAHVSLLRDRFDVVVPELAGRDVPAIVDGVARGLRAPAVVVGHSMGGQVAVRLAGDHPDLVRAVAVIDPAYGADDEEMAGAPDRLADLEQRGVPAAVEFVDRAFRTESDLWRATRTRMLEADPAVLASLYRSMYLDEDSIGSRPAAAPHLARLRVPLLSLYSNEEPARWVESLGTRSEVVVWPGTGHYLHEERPEEFCALLTGWLSRL